MKLWSHQQDMLDFVTDRWDNGQRGVLLAAAMRTGKTRVVIELLQRLVKERASGTKPSHPPLRVLIGCPKSVTPVWGHEIATWWRGRPPTVLSLGSGPTKRRAEALSKASATMDLIAVANYDGMIRGPLRLAIEAVDWDVVVADESHRLQSPGGVTSRFFGVLGARADYRLGLTGTPMPTSILNIYGQARFIDRDLYGTSYVSFRRRYTRPAYTTADYQRQDGLWLQERGDGRPTRYVPDNQDHFERVLGRFCLRVGPEALNLPPIVLETRYVELEPGARRFYNDLESELIAWVGERDGLGEPVTAVNAMVKVLRLAEVTGGAVHDEAGRLRPISTAKRKVLQDLLQDLPPREPVVVFCRFHADLDAAHAAAAAAWGQEASLELSGRQNDLEAWQGGGAPLLAVQIQAGSVGIDLSRASVGVWYTLPYSLSAYDQAQARLLRRGQRRSALWITLEAINTVDGAIAQALQRRQEVIGKILERLRGK
jgi:SNF2 family DNA or RNA helicase